jgi:glutamine amidotransferase
MCRHLAWLGQPRSLAELVLERPHGLLQQSWAPRRQAHGTVNADGWGIGFHTDQGQVARWRSVRPLWQETAFPSVAPHLRAGSVVAAVRSATVGMPIEESACAPFLAGGWLVSHNGRVDRDVLRPEERPESVCDAACLAAVVGPRIGHDADAPARLAAQVRELGSADPSARLNLVLADGSRILATTWGDTLSYRVQPGGVVVASEPDDDSGSWVDVPDCHLVEVSATGVSVTPMQGLGSPA